MSVLCVEQNGQRSIEYSVDTHCEAVTAKGLQPQESQSTVVHCADCVDIPLGVTASANPQKFADEVSVPKNATYVVAILVVTEYPNHPGLALRPALIEQPEVRAAHIGQRSDIVIQQ